MTLAPDTPPCGQRTPGLASLAACVLGLSLATAAEAQSVDPAALRAAAERMKPAVVTTLKQMVAIESGSAYAEGLAEMAGYTEARLKSLGASTQRLAPSSGHGPIVKATFTGTGRKRVMLIAHMDTVYPLGSFAAQPIHEVDGRLYAPGVADDKGGIAVVLHTLELLRDLGWRDHERLTVLFNGDEELSSPGSGETIAALADEHDYVFSFEPTEAANGARAEGVLLGAAGVGIATLEVRGRGSHAGAAPELGRNALVELAHQILATKDVAASVPGSQLHWTQATAGAVRNQIPERASAVGDVRLMLPGAAERLDAALKQASANHLVPDTQVSVKVVATRPPFAANEEARALARRAQDIYAELDGRPLRLVESTGGGTDAGFAGRSGKAVVLESLGLAGAGYHARDEYVDLGSIVPRLYLAARLITSVPPRGR